MLCLKCGHLNQPFVDICEKCNSIIPERDIPPPINERYKTLENATKQVKEREMSSGEFRNLLEEFEAKFRDTLSKTEQMEMTDEIRMEVADEISMGVGGIKLYLEAVAEMHRYLDTRQEIFLDRGLVMAKDANNRLNEAMRMNWERFRNMQETAEEFLRAQSGI